MTQTQNISSEDLVNMEVHAARCRYRIEVAYACDRNLLFAERIYKKDAKLWLYKDLAEIVSHAALYCFKTHGVHFVLYDGLRPVDAQEKMMQTKRARENPHWMMPPRLLSPPGAGGHPRGMAVDIGLETPHGDIVDMGTPFDALADSSDAARNPAHRMYPHSDDVMRNRSMLDDSMRCAAEKCGVELYLLPEEWWDFRLPATVYNKYAPLRDCDLPVHMRMMA